MCGVAIAWDRATHLVLDIDPPVADAFPLAVRATRGFSLMPAM
jgi:hypothetical protein